MSAIEEVDMLLFSIEQTLDRLELEIAVEKMNIKNALDED